MLYKDVQQDIPISPGRNKF